MRFVVGALALLALVGCGPGKVPDPAQLERDLAPVKQFACGVRVFFGYEGCAR